MTIDPDAALAELRRLASQPITLATRPRTAAHDYQRMAELITALDDWLSTGGYLPQPWTTDHDSDHERARETSIGANLPAGFTDRPPRN